MGSQKGKGLNKILIVDQDELASANYSRLLRSNGQDCDNVRSLEEASKALASKQYQAVITELDFEDGCGSKLIEDSKIPVIVATTKTSKETKQKILSMGGVVSYLEKPIENKQLLHCLTSSLSSSTQSIQNDLSAPLPGMIGSSPAMQEVYRRIRKAAPTSSTILIRGETGTGKELVAKAIHEASKRANQPFVAVNCAAIPDTLIESELFGHEKGSFTGAASKRSGLIEAAEGGTLFLDEIGELPPEAQARLLRFIQESEIRRIGSNEPIKVDVRLVAATHRDLKNMSQTMEFRPDLYYRINVFRIFLPALRERGNDLVEIADYLLQKASLKHDKPNLHFMPDALHAIKQYDWPGNVRELENVIERAVIMTDNQSINRQTLEIDLEIQSQLSTQKGFSGNVNEPVIDSNPYNINELDSLNTQKEQHDLMHNNLQNNQLHEPQEDLSLEDYFQRFVLENQDSMNETELAKKLGISRKCLWERRQRFGIPRKKS